MIICSVYYLNIFLHNHSIKDSLNKIYRIFNYIITKIEYLTIVCYSVYLILNQRHVADYCLRVRSLSPPKILENFYTKFFLFK